MGVGAGRLRALWPAILLCAAAVPARAGTIAIGFAPPVGQDLLYHIEQLRPIAGEERRFVSDRRLRFERAGDGYILHMTLTRIDSDAPPDMAASYMAALSPLLDVTHDFRVDRSGRITALDNLDAVWSKARAGLDRMAAREKPDSAPWRAARNVLALFDALSPDARIDLLAGEVRPMLLFAGAVVEDGAGRGVSTVAGAPLGRPAPVRGSVAVMGRDGDALDISENLAGEGVSVAMRYRVSARTGLIERQDRALKLGTVELRERRTITSAF
ncbi:hypothetical protein [Sphingobium fontiphilum]|uniref:hypothetical protein n=1 Tax=Sphingobium fontiphilum TaxID=944425 RepID=UPI00161BF9E2|nr:hypothetical protein [Sphingobium fontiphilum]